MGIPSGLAHSSRAPAGRSPVTAASAAAYKQARLDNETVEALRNLGHVPDARLEAVARFTEAVIATRGGVDDADFESFKAAGFSDQAALEVVLLGGQPI